jgi:hypothetical protein
MPYTPRLALVLLLLTSLATAAERQQVQTRDYRLSVSPRTPEQIGAFYEARGFPKDAIRILKQQCYLTVYFHNTSSATIWVDLADWRFSTAEGELQRLDRAYWKKRWQQQGLPQRFQSTFRWTLIPEALDYRPDEREGGNLILPYTAAPIRLQARIRIVDGNRERMESLTLENIQCAR